MAKNPPAIRSKEMVIAGKNMRINSKNNKNKMLTTPAKIHKTESVFQYFNRNRMGINRNRAIVKNDKYASSSNPPNMLYTNHATKNKLSAQKINKI